MKNKKNKIQFSQYFAQMRKEVQIYKNIENILEKIEFEGNFSTLTQIFEKIFEQELSYAVEGIFKRAQEIIVENFCT